MSRTKAEIRESLKTGFVNDTSLISMYGLVPGQTFDQQFSTASLEMMMIENLVNSIFEHEQIVSANVANTRPQNIRNFLVKHSLFDFDDLAKGETEYTNCQLFYDGSLYERKVSLVRPKAKPNRPGDPRIWIYNLNKNAKALDWIYLASKNDTFYVITINTEPKSTIFRLPSVRYIILPGLRS